MIHAMKSICLALLSAILGGLLFSGCTPVPEDESTIPWSQPASWENDKTPMMGR